MIVFEDLFFWLRVDEGFAAGYAEGLSFDLPSSRLQEVGPIFDVLGFRIHSVGSILDFLGFRLFGFWVCIGLLGLWWVYLGLVWSTILRVL